MNSAIFSERIDTFRTSISDVEKLNLSPIAETKTSMQGADGVLVLADVVDGIRVQTEKVWEFANELGLTRMVLVSKMDRERADFAKAVETIQNNFGKECVPILVPIGSAESVQGCCGHLEREGIPLHQG